VSFEWNAAKDDANLRKHGIDFADAVTVLEDESALTMQDAYSVEEERWITLGMDALGRLLVVVYTWRGDRTRLDLSTSGYSTRMSPIREKTMKKEYDFSKAKRGPVVKTAPGKTRITIRLDNAALAWFREQVHAAGGGSYQSLINDVLAQHVAAAREPLESTLRRVIREELRKAG
jgi:uncharacterized DUF497 family protein